jgi:putative endonuclease
MNPTHHKQVGQYYEKTAAEFLMRQGLKWLESNFTCRMGELDLVMRDKEVLVFVEVKYRKNQYYGHAAEAVTRSKAMKLIKSAHFWLLKHNLSPYDTDFRFDIVAIHQYGDNVDWYQNAITQE